MVCSNLQENKLSERLTENTLESPNHKNNIRQIDQLQEILVSVQSFVLKSRTNQEKSNTHGSGSPVHITTQCCSKLAAYLFFFLSKGCPSSYRNKLLSIYLLAALRFVNTSIAILFLVIYTSGLLSKSAVFIPDFRSHSKMYAEKNWEKSRDEVNSKVSSSSSKLYF